MLPDTDLANWNGETKKSGPSSVIVNNNIKNHEQLFPMIGMGTL